MPFNALKTERGRESGFFERVGETRKSVDRLIDHINNPLVHGPHLTTELSRKLADVGVDQGTDDIDAIRAMASRVMETHNRVTREVAEASGGTPTEAGELKSMDRMLEKRLEHGSYRTIGDVVRTTILFEDLESLYEAVIELYERVEIVAVKDRFVNMRPSGYRDLLFKIRLEDPETRGDHITEIQFQLESMHDAKEDEHQLYKKRRKLEHNLVVCYQEDPENEVRIERLKSEIVELQEKSRQIFDSAWEPFKGKLDDYRKVAEEMAA
ncbi:hypothetical protein KJ657_04950 [Patescibacteria group bacterium]|nr:hypothetical protein [Patescibacteria group bacterium]MBU1016403.1 hypothetical protein [Patescibacteria group bacterium]MBU1685151.1 hypothetical protein [Patescibacteria group bacterium]MBU1938808.1 hypothetical protein [Patescibacteria group bacterium]